jgi:hypothetical protein
MISALVDRFGQWNPQLFRELKGRLKPRNITIAAVFSLTFQLLTYLYFQNLLPLPPSAYHYPDPEISNRYCIGSPPKHWSGYDYSNSSIPNDYCVKDMLGNWMLNWQLWWLDIFICLSIVALFALLVAGTWMLISDLSREERRGTLNFIRMSPQSAKTILVGKMLGVPIALFLTVALAIPLHLAAGLSARIPLGLILAFYGVLAASCIFFYSAALLFGLVSTGLGGFQSWLGSGMVLLFLWVMTGVMMSTNAYHDDTILNVLAIFYPGHILPYLVDATYLPAKTVGYWHLHSSKELYVEGLASWQWYGQSLWRSEWSGIGFALLNYGLWIYWVAIGLARRFHNPLTTVWSKGQSYLMTGSFAAITVGFIPSLPDNRQIFNNFGWLQVMTLLFFWMLIAVLSPHRQTLQDWARYRHQMPRNRRNLLKNLIWGETSPAIVAIAINFAIILAFALPVALVLQLDNLTMPVLFGLILEGGIILIYAAIAQLMLMMKTPKRVVATASLIGALAIVPPVYFAIASIDPSELTLMWLFTSIPGAATEHAAITTIGLGILGQWSIMTMLSVQMTRQLKQAGESVTRQLAS